MSYKTPFLIKLITIFCYLIQPFMVYAVNSERDPTKPADFIYSQQKPEIKNEDLEINAIMKRRDKFFAIINNQQAKVGDSVNGWSVLDISATSVLMKQMGDREFPPVQFTVSESINVKQQVNID